MGFVTLPPGARLGRYRIERVLGQGGMGVVYEAQDESLERPVALKVLPRELVSNARFVARFRREGNAAASISHPNVVGVHLVGEEGGALVMALELVPGGNLRSRLQERGQLPWREAARLGAQIARGLQAIHEAGLVHRDLKPENVLLDEQGRPLLTDFGVVGGERASGGELTKTGELVGTLEYVSPEQVESSKDVDYRADLYSFGAMLYALLSGKPPFSGHGLVLVKMHLRDRPRPLRELVPDVPARFERLVNRLLEKKPDARPASADLVAEELDEIARVRDVSPERRPGKLALALVALAVVSGGVAAAVAMSGKLATPEPPPPPPPPATPPAPPPPAGPVFPDLVRGFRQGRTWRLASTWGKFDWKHAYVVSSVSFSSDGKNALSGSYDGTAKLWEVASGRELLSLPAGPGPVFAVFSPDGKRALTGGADGALRVWDLATGKMSREIAAHDGGITSVACSHDGKTALTLGGHDREGDVDRKLKHWDLASGECLRAIDHGCGTSYTAAFLPGDGRAILAGAGSQVGVFDLATGSARRISLGGGRLASLAVSRDGRLAVTGGFDRKAATLLDLDEGRVVRDFGKLDYEVFSVALSPDGALAFLGGRDEVELWETRGERLFRKEGVVAYALAFSPDAKRALSGHGDLGDHAVRLWDLATASEAGAREGFDGSVWALAVSPQGPCGIARMERKVELREVRTGGAVRTFPHPIFSAAASLSPDGSLVLVQRENRAEHELTLCDARTGETRWTRPHPTAPTAGALSRDRRSGLTGGADGNVYRIELESGDLGLPVATTSPVKALAFLGTSGERWLAGGADGTVALAPATTEAGARATPLGSHASAVTALAADRAEGELALSGDDSGLVKLWAISKARAIDLLPRHEGAVLALAVSPDGLTAASAAQDGKIAIWDARTGRELERIDLATSSDKATALVFEDGKTLLAGTGRGVVHRFALAK